MRTHEEIVNKSWLKEPRKFKPTPKNYFGNAAFYDKYKEMYWEDHHNRITRRTFQKLLFAINQAIQDAIVKEAFEYIMPHGTGMIYVGLKKPTKLRTLENGQLNRPIDRKATVELWASNKEAFEKRTKVYYSNLHSNGKIAKIAYMTYRYAFYKGKHAVTFVPVRDFKRSVSHVMKNLSLYPKAVYYNLKDD